MKPHKGGGTTPKLLVTGECHISTYLEAVIFLLKPYATDFDIAKTTPYITCLKQAPMNNFVQFADVP